MIYFVLSLIAFVVGVWFYRHRKDAVFTPLLLAAVIFFYLLLLSAHVVSDYFTGEGVNDAVVYHVLYGLDGAGFSEYSFIIISAVLLVVASFVLSVIYYRFSRARNNPEIEKGGQYFSILVLVLAFAINPVIISLWGATSIEVVNQLSSTTTARFTRDDSEFLEYYSNEELKEGAGEHLNLVYIYAESLERTYFDEALFPGLLPELGELKKTGLDFSNIRQITGSKWTVAGMASSQCGVPLFATSEGNSMSGLNSIYAGARCLGDLLHEGGYKLAYMQGSSIEFSGIEGLYTAHRFDEVYGKEQLIRRLADREYLNAWGLFDDSLLSLAYEKFEELSSGGSRFGLVVTTMDTHHPKGHQSESCEGLQYKKGKNPILNAAMCSDSLISQFIRKIQASSSGENTVIILGSDHLAMRNSATSMLKKGNRRNLFIIIDPRENSPQVIDRRGAMIDIPSTIARKLGYGNSIGLGRDLLGSENNLSELHGDVNALLEGWKSSIHKLWGFPRVEGVIFIDPDNEAVNITGQQYELPVLVSIDDEQYITPYFEFSSPLKTSVDSETELQDYLLSLDKSAAFMWIDSCRETNYLAGSFDDDFCVVMGKMGGKVTSTGVNGPLELQNNFILSQTYIDEDLVAKRRLDILSSKIGFDLSSLDKELPEGSNVYVGKSSYSGLLNDYFQSIRLVPVSSTRDLSEFYFIGSELETEHLADEYNIEAIITESWGQYFSNFERVLLRGKHPDGLLLKATRM